jgi:hypothetical protein
MRFGFRRASISGRTRNHFKLNNRQRDKLDGRELRSRVADYDLLLQVIIEMPQFGLIDDGIQSSSVQIANRTLDEI